MSAIRNCKYKDYGLKSTEIFFILNYCQSEQADDELIHQCSTRVNQDLAEYLYKSVKKKKSYERLGYVPINKCDFYAYRRKLLALLKVELVYRGEM